jgi:hypothetical protein
VTLRLRVGGLTLAVSAARETVALRPPRALRPFLHTRGADIALRLTTEPPPDPPPGSLLFDSGGIWRVHRLPSGELLYSFRTRRVWPPVYKAVRIDADLRRGVLHFPKPQRGRGPVYALDYPLDELLFQHRLAREGALEVHACGLIVDGRAVLFAGRSGAGKSTTGRLWRKLRRGTRVLSDDRVVLRARRGRPWAYGTPWHGEGGFAMPDAKPLAVVFFLRHAKRTRVTRLPQPQAAARLYARTFPPVWDADAVGRTLEACASTAAAVPCYDLAFTPDRTAVDAVLDVLNLGS